MGSPEPYPPELLVVCPVRDAQGTVAQTYVDVDRALRYVPVRARIVFVDCGSGDRTQEVLEEFRRKDGRLGVLSLPAGSGEPEALAAAEAAQGAQTVIVVGGPGVVTPSSLRNLLGTLGRGTAPSRRPGGVWGYRREQAAGIRVA